MGEGGPLGYSPTLPKAYHIFFIIHAPPAVAPQSEGWATPQSDRKLRKKNNLRWSLRSLPASEYTHQKHTEGEKPWAKGDRLPARP